MDLLDYVGPRLNRIYIMIILSLTLSFSYIYLLMYYTALLMFSLAPFYFLLSLLLLFIYLSIYIYIFYFLWNQKCFMERIIYVGVEIIVMTNYFIIYLFIFKNTQPFLLATVIKRIIYLSHLFILLSMLMFPLALFYFLWD